jgi:SanA protein
MKRWLSWILVGVLLLLGTPLALRLWAKWHYQALIYHDVDRVPAYPVAIVLGAGVYPDGRLTPVLEDRVKAAIDLYRAAKVKRLLFTGDNRTTHYNEPGRMFEYAVAQGLPPEAIVLDYAGRRTYDSCYRARTIFQVEQAIVVTQGFHQPRALFLCERLGLEVVGLTADQRPYPGLSRMWWQTREIPALVLAWWDVNIRRPIPVLGDPLPIFKVAEWR